MQSSQTCHLSSDRFLEATTKKTTPGKILAVSTEIVASQSNSFHLQDCKTVNRRSLARQRLQLRRGDILTKRSHGKSWPPLDEQVLDSVESDAAQKRGQRSKEWSLSKTVMDEENRGLTGKTDRDGSYVSRNRSSGTDDDDYSGWSSSSEDIEVELRDVSEEEGQREGQKEKHTRWEGRGGG